MPKISVTGNLIRLSAVVAVTTDVGELLDEELTLRATIHSARSQSTHVQQSTVWQASMRVLPLSIDLSNANLTWPSKLHVGLFNNDGGHNDEFDSLGVPGNSLRLVSVASDLLDPTRHIFESSRRTERRFMPFSQQPLLLFEDARFSGQNAINDEQLASCIIVDRIITLRSTLALPLLERRLSAATKGHLSVLELGCGSAAVAILLTQVVPGCRAVVAGGDECAKLAELNIRASKPAAGSSTKVAKLSSETALPQDEMAREFDIIIITWPTRQDSCKRYVTEAAKQFTAQNPRTLVLLACKAVDGAQENLKNMLDTQGFKETGKTTIPFPSRDFKGRQIPPSGGVKIAEFSRHRFEP